MNTQHIDYTPIATTNPDALDSSVSSVDSASGVLEMTTLQNSQSTRSEFGSVNQVVI